MDVKIIAVSLLILRLVSTIFLILVLRRQLHLIKKTDTDLDSTRKLLFLLVFIALLGNIVPIIIDLITFLEPDSRSNPSPLGVLYAYSNAITAAVVALGWWFLYRLIQHESKQMRADNKQLTFDNKQLRKNNKALKRDK